MGGEADFPVNQSDEVKCSKAPHIAGEGCRGTCGHRIDAGGRGLRWTACAGAGGGRASGAEAAPDEVGLPEVGVETLT